MSKNSGSLNIIYIILFILIIAMAANKKPPIEDEKIQGFSPITYKEARDFAIKSEQNIINSNSHQGLNKYKEPAWDVIIYSDEYRALYCTYWSVLEEIGESGMPFGENKLRWQIDFTNEEWKKILLDAFYTGGADAFFTQYADMYVEKVIPAVQKQWDESQ